jgi:hypothetical protein
MLKYNIMKRFSNWTVILVSSDHSYTSYTPQTCEPHQNPLQRPLSTILLSSPQTMIQPLAHTNYRPANLQLSTGLKKWRTKANSIHAIFTTWRETCPSINGVQLPQADVNTLGYILAWHGTHWHVTQIHKSYQNQILALRMSSTAVKLQAL